MVWLFLIAGLAILTFVVLDRAYKLTKDDGIFVNVFHGFMALGGLVFIWISVTALASNTSRGCRIDTSTGVFQWWLMKGNRALERSGHVALADISRIVVASSSDDTKVYLYTFSSTDPLEIELQALPHNYRAWMTALSERYPHITFEQT